jgi:hypothetical protein
MTLAQRIKSQHRQAVQAAVERFIGSPLQLSRKQTRELLGRLCVDLGNCLKSEHHDHIESEPPTNPRDFAKLVMKLEGVGIGDSEMYAEVLQRVLLAFESALADADQSQCQWYPTAGNGIAAWWSNFTASRSACCRLIGSP